MTSSSPAIKRRNVVQPTLIQPRPVGMREACDMHRRERIKAVLTALAPCTMGGSGTYRKTLVFTDLDLENYSHLRRVYFTHPKANIVTLPVPSLFTSKTSIREIPARSVPSSLSTLYAPIMPEINTRKCITSICLFYFFRSLIILI